MDDEHLYASAGVYAHNRRREIVMHSLRKNIRLKRRTDKIIEALQQADASSRMAALRTWHTALVQVQGQPVDEAAERLADRNGYLLAAYRGNECPELRADGLLIAARLLYERNLAACATGLAQRALEIARQLNEPELHRRAANVCGALHKHQRNLAGALTAYEEAYRVARTHGGLQGQAAVIANIAVCLQEVGQYEQAITVHQKAVELASALSGERARFVEAQALANMLHCRLARDEVELALAAGARVAAMIDALQCDPIARYQFESFYTAALLRAERTAEARARLQVLREANLHSTAQTEVLLTISQGLCEVYSGQADVGITRLERLLARVGPSEYFADDVLRALIQAHEKCGNVREALGYVVELAAYLGEFCTLQLHQQLAQLQEESFAELDQDSQAAILLGNQATDLRVQAFEAQLAARERTLLENWAVAATLIGDSTGRHCYHVGRLAYLLARRLGIMEVDAHTIELAARLHDIGVLGINHLVLAKPSRLNHIERLVVRQHTVIGSEMLGRGRHPSVQLAAKVALTHHEWWDGSGYPNQLHQEQIPLEARIVALADAYDAMAGERPYQLAFSHTMACEELHFMSGKQFDPNLVTAFIEIVDDYRSRYGDLGDAGYRSWVADSAILSRHEQILELLALE